MAKDTEHLENINTREFYEFYKKTRRKPSKKIDQYNFFVKAINGFLIELKKSVEEVEHGVHLRGLGVIYKKPYGKFFRRMTLFTHKKGEKGISYFYLEDDYLRSKYIIKKVAKRVQEATWNKRANKPNAIMLHRKLIKKNGASNT